MYARAGIASKMVVIAISPWSQFSFGSSFWLLGECEEKKNDREKHYRFTHATCVTQSSSPSDG